MTDHDALLQSVRDAVHTGDRTPAAVFADYLQENNLPNAHAFRALAERSSAPHPITLAAYTSTVQDGDGNVWGGVLNRKSLPALYIKHAANDRQHGRHILNLALRSKQDARQIISDMPKEAQDMYEKELIPHLPDEAPAKLSRPSEHDALLRAAVAGDKTAAMALGDWLEEHGRPNAHLWREHGRRPYKVTRQIFHLGMGIYGRQTTDGAFGLHSWHPYEDGKLTDRDEPWADVSVRSKEHARHLLSDHPEAVRQAAERDFIPHLPDEAPAKLARPDVRKLNDYWSFLNQLADKQDAGEPLDRNAAGAFADWLDEHNKPTHAMLLRKALYHNPYQSSLPAVPQEHPAHGPPVEGLRDWLGSVRHQHLRTPQRFYTSDFIHRPAHNLAHDVATDSGAIKLLNNRRGWSDSSANAPTILWSAHIPAAVSTAKRMREMHVSNIDKPLTYPVPRTVHFTAPLTVDELHDFVSTMPKSRTRATWQRAAEAIFGKRSGGEGRSSNSNENIGRLARPADELSSLHTAALTDPSAMAPYIDALQEHGLAGGQTHEKLPEYHPTLIAMRTAHAAEPIVNSTMYQHAARGEHSAAADLHGKAARLADEYRRMFPQHASKWSALANAHRVAADWHAYWAKQRLARTPKWVRFAGRVRDVNPELLRTGKGKKLAENITQYTDSPDSHRLVYSHGDEPIAAMRLGVKPDNSAYVAESYTKPAYRGQQSHIKRLLAVLKDNYTVISHPRSNAAVVEPDVPSPRTTVDKDITNPPLLARRLVALLAKYGPLGRSSAQQLGNFTAQQLATAHKHAEEAGQLVAEKVKPAKGPHATWFRLKLARPEESDVAALHASAANDPSAMSPYIDALQEAGIEGGKYLRKLPADHPTLLALRATPKSYRGMMRPLASHAASARHADAAREHDEWMKAMLNRWDQYHWRRINSPLGHTHPAGARLQEAEDMFAKAATAHRIARDWHAYWSKQKLARVRTGGQAAGVADKLSSNHAARVSLAKRVLSETGLLPATVRSVLSHTDERGVRPGVLAAIHKEVPDELLHYAASWLGMLTGEKRLTTFRPGAGNDSLHIIDTPAKQQDVGEYLRRMGAQFSLDSSGGGTRALLVNPTIDTSAAARGLSGTVKSLTGTAKQLGSGDDSDARARYRHTISKTEQSAGVSPGPTGVLQ